MLWTPIAGWLDIIEESFVSVDEHIPAPFIHYLGDDFSPNGTKEFEQFLGPIERDGEVVGERIMYTCESIGATERPNMGLSFQHIWNVARDTEDCEAILSLFCNVVLQTEPEWPSVVGAFRESQKIHGPKAGAITALITRHREDTVEYLNHIWGFGGCRTRPFMGIELRTRIGAWNPHWPAGPPRHDILPWCHLSAMWIPRSTFMRSGIMPDPQFRLYWVDHDICIAMKKQGLDILITDHAVVARHYGAKATGISPLFASSKEKVVWHDAQYEILKKKWSMD